MTKTIRFIVVLAVIGAALAWASTHPTITRGGTLTWTSACSPGTSYTDVHVQAVGSFTWAIKQHTAFTVCADSYYIPGYGTIVRARIYERWSYCESYAAVIGVAVQRCSGLRLSAGALDMTVDYTKTSPWPFSITTSCTSRVRAVAGYTVNPYTHAARPYLSLGPQRASWWC